MLEHAYRPTRLNSAIIFDAWSPACICSEVDCRVVLPEEVEFGDPLHVWPFFVFVVETRRRNLARLLHHARPLLLRTRKGLLFP